MAETIDAYRSAWHDRRAAAFQARQGRAQHVLGRLREVVPAWAHEFGATKVTLFGSFARLEPREESDLDLFVEGLSKARYFDAVASLSRLMALDVDLVCEVDASALLRARVEEEGVPIDV